MPIAKPIQAAAGDEHICEKDQLKGKEHDAAHHLSVIEVAKAEQEEGQLDSPVAFGKGCSDIQYFVFYGNPAGLDKSPNPQSNVLEPNGDRADKHQQIIPKGLKLIQL